MDIAQRLDPKQCVLVAVDVQNDFCHPDGAKGRRLGAMPEVQDAVQRLCELIDQAHAIDIPVVFLQNTHSADTDTDAWLARRPSAGGSGTCPRGEWGAEFYRVSPRDCDYVVEKHRYNGFVGSTLGDVLRQISRPSLLFGGVATNICVESTLRDAVCRDYLGTLVEDCAAAYAKSAHDRAVAAIRDDFGLVTTSEVVRDHWRSAVAAHTAHANP